MEQRLKKERNLLLSRFEKLLEGPMVVLGFIWLILLVIELVWGLPPLLEYLSLAIWVLFLLDFGVKLILAPQKGRFIKRNWLTAISLVIPALRVVRFVRFVRLLRGLRGVRLIRIVSSLNRGMRSLAATMQRRAFGYVLLLTLLVTFAGAAGMYALEKDTEGFQNYSLSLWWTAMRIITAGSSAEPVSAEGRALAFLLALFGYTIFGYVTASFASFFVGRDAEEQDAPVAGAQDVQTLRQEIGELKNMIRTLQEATSSEGK
jgi:voltage-gated potassium channel